MKVTEEETEITILYGGLSLREFYPPQGKTAEGIRLNGKQIPARQKGGTLVFEELSLQKDDRITVRWREE